MTADIWNNLEAFVTEDAGKPIVGRLQLTRETDLYHDLFMNPDYISEFMKRWAAQFHVELNGFDLHHYSPLRN
ncbi:MULTISPECIES: DUF1493 family protein [unclassified Paraburkholderia]|uniref:DUF1493 family protein n=1 Tax=unclassified Paraburkholderia TaxID=2615204 RepID=UPI0038BD1E64